MNAVQYLHSHQDAVNARSNDHVAQWGLNNVVQLRLVRWERVSDARTRGLLLFAVTVRGTSVQLCMARH